MRASGSCLIWCLRPSLRRCSFFSSSSSRRWVTLWRHPAGRRCFQGIRSSEASSSRSWSRAGRSPRSSSVLLIMWTTCPVRTPELTANLVERWITTGSGIALCLTRHRFAWFHHLRDTKFLSGGRRVCIRWIFPLFRFMRKLTEFKLFSEIHLFVY